ncbi:MAG: UDP-N-acetylmuramoyl-tripeptide--D-alanyl-D-alanine ligase [Acidimicrobiales bacterium]
MELDLAAVASATNGTCFGPQVQVKGVSIDSRTIQPGQLFVPISADRDGHDFIPSALANGACAYLTALSPGEGSGVVVGDTAEALLDLGHFAHSQLDVTATIAITGSVGKTSVKDLTAAALRPSLDVHATPGSFNNELGLPLTLLNAPADTDVLVLEMGARGLGQITRLTEIAPPTIGIVTAVVMAHTELFGSIDEVAQGKGELIAAVPGTGTAILNADDQRVMAMAGLTDATVVTYGFRDADVTVEDAKLGSDLCPSFTLRTPSGSTKVRLNIAGMHNASNAAAATAAALAAGANLDSIAVGLEQAQLSPSRMAVSHQDSGAVVIDDAYNANPTSMRAALDALSALPHANKVAVVGLMAELGEERELAHRQIVAYAQQRDIRLIAVGTDLYGLDAVDSWQEAAAALGDLGAHDAVLVKGSLVAGLRSLSHHLTVDKS